MASKPAYTRATDTKAYSFGERFFSLMDNKVKTKGGLKPFMREMMEKQSFKPLTTEEFIGFMDSFYGMSFTADFKKYVYGGNKEVSETKGLEFEAESHEIHKQMTIEELKSFL
jgi:predicted metalloprotease with PDZ domain